MQFDFYHFLSWIYCLFVCLFVCLFCRQDTPNTAYDTKEWIERIVILGISNAPKGIFLTSEGQLVVMPSKWTIFVSSVRDWNEYEPRFGACSSLLWPSAALLLVHSPKVVSHKDGWFKGNRRTAAH